MDAHSLRGDGPSRLCYAGSVLHTKPKSLMASRSPIQIGAELYGDGSLNSDIEVISLMLETLTVSGIDQITLDLGHVGIYRALIEQSELTADAEEKLFSALQRKSSGDIESAIQEGISDSKLADMMRALSTLNGDRSILDKAKVLLGAAPAQVLSVIDDLSLVADQITSRMPSVNIYFDLTELRGYHYHTGLVFSALAPGHGQAIANGGRYDDIGEVFGRARPATGFNTDLKALLGYLPKNSSDESVYSILAPDSYGLSDSDSLSLWQTIQQLRANGECVINALPGQQGAEQYRRHLVLKQNRWLVDKT
jgi:ATP phosphoribosyltransferase regulatory subunit